MFKKDLLIEAFKQEWGGLRCYEKYCEYKQSCITPSTSYLGTMVFEYIKFMHYWFIHDGDTSKYRLNQVSKSNIPLKWSRVSSLLHPRPLGGSRR